MAPKRAASPGLNYLAIPKAPALPEEPPPPRPGPGFLISNTFLTRSLQVLSNGRLRWRLVVEAGGLLPVGSGLVIEALRGRHHYYSEGLSLAHGPGPIAPGPAVSRCVERV
jgi:hypothetical protein